MKYLTRISPKDKVIIEMIIKSLLEGVDNAERAVSSVVSLPTKEALHIIERLQDVIG